MLTQVGLSSQDRNGRPELLTLQLTGNPQLSHLELPVKGLLQHMACVGGSRLVALDFSDYSQLRTLLCDRSWYLTSLNSLWLHCAADLALQVNFKV